MDKCSESHDKNEITSSNECTTDDHQGDPSSCFLPPDPSTEHSAPSNVEGIVFDPSHHGFIPEESTSTMFPPESYNDTVPSAEGDVEENEDDQGSTISELSGLSDLSNFSSQDLKPDSGPMSWVQRQMISGVDPRLILGELLPKGTCIPYNVNDGLLWRLVVNLLSEPKRTKLSHINTMDDVMNLLKNSKKIMVLTGAGVSVSCGIPDFRSRDGIYARLKKDYPALPDPQAMFDIQFFRRDPRPFFKFAKEIYPGQFEPSPSHRFIKVLEKQNKLLRNYSQNIDTLEHAAGIQNVITCHGSFATASCTVCGHKVDSSVIKEDIFLQRIPFCPICPAEVGDRGIMKPDIVFFGEGLSDEFHEALANDKEACDLLIVMGSSLKVRPVAMIPSSIPTHVPQILINREPLDHLTFDVELLGDCDVIIGEICRRLDSEWDIDERIPRFNLHEIIVQSSQLHPEVLDSEVNNNSNSVEPEKSNLPQSEESNSCDCRGLSAIKLDDSEDGSSQELPSPSTTALSEVQQPAVMDDKSLWSADSKESLSKSIPDQSYLHFPPSRYIFTGAEVYKETDHDDDDEHCSTPTDYSSDCDSPSVPMLSSSTNFNCVEKTDLTNEQSSCKPVHSEQESTESPNS